MQTSRRALKALALNVPRAMGSTAPVMLHRTGRAPRSGIAVFLALLAAAATGVPAPEQGASAPPREFAIVGAGSFICREFVTFEPTVQMAGITWVQGYMSGANTFRNKREGKQMLLLPKGNETNAFIMSYCKKSPDKSIWEAAESLWQSVAQ